MVRKIFDPLADTLQRALSAKKSLSSEEFKAKVDSLSPDVRRGLVAYVDARIDHEKSPELRAQLQALKDDLSL